MKYYILLYILFFTKLALGKTIISGQILNYDGKSKLAYTSTVEGIYTPYWIDLYPKMVVLKLSFTNLIWVQHKLCF